MALRDTRSTDSESAASSTISVDPETEGNASGVLVDRQQIEEWLIIRIASMQKLDPEQVDVDESFVANGLSSRSSVVLTGDLARALGVTLSETLTWEYPTIATLAEHVAGIGAGPLDD